MTGFPILVQRKAALRADALARRRRIPPSYVKHAAEVVSARLVDDLRMPRGFALAGYWPLEGELDPRPGMERLGARGHPLALPRMNGQGQPLVFHAWRPGDVLTEGAFRVMEPCATQPVCVPDLILVPLLAFDRRGGRLGYGMGFYDRTLSGLGSGPYRPQAFGFAFADQEVDEVPMGPGDVWLDGVITETALRRFTERDQRRR